MTLTEAQMRAALTALDRFLAHSVTLVVGGGGAMVLAYHFPLATSDIDAIPTKGTTLSELDGPIRKVAAELAIPEDWMNPYFSTFTHVLPPDYASRLVPVMTLSKLTVQALSRDDLLIMKCFAGRMKDRPHAEVLIKKGARPDFAEKHMAHLKREGIPGADKALEFLEEIRDRLEV